MSEKKSADGRGTRGRAARNPTPGQQRPPSRGTLPAVPPQRVSPTSAAAQSLEGMHLQGGNGDDPARFEGDDDNGGNGNGNGGNGSGNGNGRASRRGDGNGNGRGDSAAGLRGTARPPRTLAHYDIINTRPEGKAKQGTAGNPSQLVANFFNVHRTESWCLYQFRVDFAPELDHTATRKYLLRQHGTTIGTFIFDGTMMFTTNPLCEQGQTKEYSGVRTTDQMNFTITVRRVGQVDPFTPMYIQFYNIVVRKCQEALELTLMGRNYFDSSAAIPLPQERLELWPGFITVLRQHENSLLMCVETTHKVVRTESVLTAMSAMRTDLQRRNMGFEQVKAEVASMLIGTIVMTSYNKRTYRVDDILWNERASDTFPLKNGTSTTFREYYQRKHNVTIRSEGQPLLLSNPKPRDVRRGQGPIRLIPELCQMTGLTDQMRQNFGLMKQINNHLFQPPQAKLQQIVGFVQRIKGSATITEEMQRWGLNIEARPVPVPGRLLPREKLIFRDRRNQKPVDQFTDDKGDWTTAFRNFQMVSSIPLKNWVVIVPQRDFHSLESLLKTMVQVASPLGFNIGRPLDMIQLNDSRTDSYIRCVKDAVNKYHTNLQMIFVVLPNNKLETYAAVKKLLNVDHGITSQCFVAKNLSSKGIMSIATKVVVQMNAKLGGEPWLFNMPLKKTMVVGFDVYHGGAPAPGSSISAMVCSTTTSYGRYFSTLSFHDNRGEVSTKVGGDFFKCLRAYQEINNVLPERVVFYRDGVGEGQLEHVVNTELEAIKKCITETYTSLNVTPANLIYIIVTKKINARIFQRVTTGPGGGFDNPTPGTVVDDVITWPERYDFFLIAQGARQGTVSPTNYNVIYDGVRLEADKLQILSYKLCHGYYNWSGTVAVPAQCQYAHKLAYLTGMATKGPAHQKLNHLLYYL